MRYGRRIVSVDLVLVNHSRLVAARCGRSVNTSAGFVNVMRRILIALLVAGVSLVDEAPLAALAARQVTQRGGRLFVVNSGERYLTDGAEVFLPVHPADLAATIETIARRVSAGAGEAAGEATDPLARTSAALAAAARPGLLFGGEANPF